VQGGGTVFDTARCYGRAEEVLGTWFKYSGAREEIVLISKGCNPTYDADGRAINRINEKDLDEDFSRTMEALDTPYIDIYFLHKDDPTVGVGEAIEMLNKYVKMGAVRHLGASNWSAERIEAANAYAREHGLLGFEFSELAFSLRHNSTTSWGARELAREMTASDYEWYAQTKMPVFGFTAQASGSFYKPIKDTATEQNRITYARVGEIAEKYGISRMQTLFGAYFGSDIVNIPLVSASSPEHMQEIVDNCDVTLSREDARYLLEQSIGFSI
jgi:aryl-alcohol dehydrogenase-like predicted oxidoreductase